MPEPRTEEENEFLTDFSNAAFWLGAVKSSEERFAWLSDGTEVVYTNWFYNQRTTENQCVYKLFNKDTWHTNPCNSQGNSDRYKIVCQRNNGKFSCYFCE